MALVVEDGTGLETAEAYGSVADADTYFSVRPTEPNVATWTAASTADKESALRVGAEWLDMTYGSRWRGRRKSEDQALDWPRQRAKDDDSYSYDDTALPVVLVRANFESALRVLVENADSTSLTPDVDTPGAVVEEALRADVLSIRTRYAGSASQLKQFTKIDRLVRQLIHPAGQVLRS